MSDENTQGAVPTVPAIGETATAPVIPGATGVGAPPMPGTNTPPPPQGATAPQPPVSRPPTRPATPEEIAARLGGKEVEQPGAAREVQEPTASEPVAFDVSKLSPEQLIALRSALDNAPLRVAKKGNPIVKLRRIDGRIVLDFKNCYIKLHKDDLTGITSEVVMIPVNFMGDNGQPEMGVDKNNATVKKFEDIIYRDFMNADQLKCEVLSQRRVEDGFDEGMVESNERPGVMVEMHVTTVQDFFTVQLPEGSPVPQVEIEGKIANA